MQISIEGIPQSGVERIIREVRSRTNFQVHPLVKPENLDSLESQIQMLLPFAGLDRNVTNICQCSPLSLSKVFLDKRRMLPLRYNLYKKLLSRITWKPQVIYFVQTDDVDPDDLIGRYRYVLKHLKDVVVVEIPDGEGEKTQFVLQDIEARCHALNVGQTISLR